MNWTPGDVTAIVAIVVGGIVTLSGVYIAARQARGARIQDRRTDAYVRIFRIASQITVQADQHVYFPGSAIEDDPEREMERQAAAEMAIMGSESGTTKYLLWQKEIVAYWPLVHTAASARWRADKLAEALDENRKPNDLKPSEWDLARSEAESARIQLIKPMEQIRKHFNGLEEVLRKESLSKGWIQR